MTTTTAIPDLYTMFAGYHSPEREGWFFKSKHNANISWINSANLLSYFPYVGTVIGIIRIFIATFWICNEPSSKDFPLSPGVPLLLRGIVELTFARPMLILVDLVVTVMRRNNYLKSWKFNF